MWNGPAPKIEDRQKVRQEIVEIIARYPDSGLAQTFPDLAKQAEIVEEYTRLQHLHDAGMIDEIDYQIALDKLAKQVDIDEITGSTTKQPLPGRFF